MPATRLPRIALTAGEPAGIGPELVVKLAATNCPADLVVIGDGDLIANTAKKLAIPITLEAYKASVTPKARHTHSLRIAHTPLSTPATPGLLNANNAAYVLDTLRKADEGAQSGEFDAIVTAPVHKGIINTAGIPFTGHTEFFAERAATPVVMMLVAETLRVALATTHLALKEVAAAITPDLLLQIVTTVHHDLRNRFSIASPRIAVLGLNPHAGESGYLGCEEIEVIAPVMAQLREQGMDLLGPLSADTAFIPEQLARYDAVIAMYHDQGLPVLKYAGFGHAVNVTLGLPYIRTSVDHGTGLDIAGTGKADPGSLIAAAQLALTLIKHA